MKKESFFIKICEELQKRMGKEVVIKSQKVRKNNNVIYQGLIIQQPDKNIAPTIYLDTFFEAYENGESIEKTVEHILEIYRKGEVSGSIDMEFFRDFNVVKKRIAYRLINAEKNKELLEQIPHILFMDLAICFYYAFQNEELGDGMILIHNSHMEMWGTNHEELMKMAQENTKNLFPPLVATMEMVLKELFEDSDKPKLYVLTNQQKCHGAVAILYPEVLENAAKQLKGNFYVLPSSVHEVILLKEHGNEDKKALHEMILEANRTQVLEEEILSDYPYYYDAIKKKLTLVKEFN